MSICFWPEIQNITPSDTDTTATVMTRDSQWTIVLCQANSAFAQYAKLPSDCEVGDIVEVHTIAGHSGTNVALPDGDTGEGIGGVVTPFTIRKLGPTFWGLV